MLLSLGCVNRISLMCHARGSTGCISCQSLRTFPQLSDGSGSEIVSDVVEGFQTEPKEVSVGI